MSTDFIQTLEQEHSVIREIFDAIDASSDLENQKKLTQDLLEVLTPHLRKEDDQLYPTLVKSPDEEVRQMANIFHLTMEAYAENFAAVAKVIMELEGNAIPKEVLTDYEKIRDKIKDRITIEEVTIFPAYEKSIA